MRTKRLIVAAAGTLLVAGLAGGVAYATIPSDTNVFTACTLKNVGTIRLIDPSLPSSSLLSHCTSLETQVSWNQKGQPGAPGLAGAVGPAGPAGPAGKDGTNGKNGLDGTDGVDGNDGLNGTSGSDGTDGVSVTSAGEPAGTNCANGGSKFTAADNSVTYACNGIGGGVTGHEVVHAFGGPRCQLVSQFGITGCSGYAPGLATATCPAGKVATGGGSDGDTSRPEGDNAWVGVGHDAVGSNGFRDGREVNVWVVCFNAG